MRTDKAYSLVTNRPTRPVQHHLLEATGSAIVAIQNAMTTRYTRKYPEALSLFAIIPRSRHSFDRDVKIVTV